MRNIFLNKFPASRILSLFVPFMFLQMFTSAQNSLPFDAGKLALSLSVSGNVYESANQTTLRLILINNDKKSLPAQGWKIYFNSKFGLSIVDKARLSLRQLKANLFELAPLETFSGIAAGKKDSINIQLDGRILNKNDQPEGFYLVRDNDPGKGYDIKELAITAPALPDNGSGQVSDFAMTVYKENASLSYMNEDSLPKILPTPLQYKTAPGTVEIKNNSGIVADPAFQKEAQLLANDLELLLGKKIIIGPMEKAGSIYLNRKDGLGPEAYEMIVDAGGIKIFATTTAGIFYGIQSLKMIFPPRVWGKQQSLIKVPFVQVIDSPRFQYRGLMVDVARNFQTKEEVRRILDLMALYKLNVFHFHLTDDEGWRLEIDGLPELTGLGANRGHSLDEQYSLPAAYGSGASTGKLYGSGYYTRQDFIELLKYADERHIKVIAEIETPGHARAAIKAMDARYRDFKAKGKPFEALEYFLRDTSDLSVYTTPQSLHDNVMNVALPSVYTFTGKIIREIDRLYKEAGLSASSIHFGGDEVPAGAWEQSPACNELIRKNPSLHNTNDLWYYYLGRIQDSLRSYGIALSGWEEIGLRKTITDGKKVMIPNPAFANNDMRLYVWNNIDGNEDLAYKLANAGYKVILAPVTNFYFDMIQYKTYDEPGYYWGGITSIEKAYKFIPFDYLKNVDDGRSGDLSFLKNKQRLTDYGKNNITGLEAAIWGETIKGPQQLEYMLLPRLLALSERAWAQNPGWATETDSMKIKTLYNKSLSTFMQIAGTRQLLLLDHYQNGYHYRIPPAGAITVNSTVVANTSFSGFVIRYTVNGMEPTGNSKIYTGPIKAKGIIRLKVFNNTGRASYMTTIENK